MEKAVYSVDFSKKIKKAKAGEGSVYEVVCGHCGAVAAKLVNESCGDSYEEPIKYNGPPPKEEKKAFQASSNRFGNEKPSMRDPREYKRSLPKYFPEVNHGFEIVCANCGNLAAKLYPLRDDMYAEREQKIFILKDKKK